MGVLSVPDDCDSWLVVAIGMFMLFIISELMPFFGSNNNTDTATEADERNAQGILHFMTLIIRSRWVREHPMVQELLRFGRDVFAGRRVQSPTEGVSTVNIEVEIRSNSSSDSITPEIRPRETVEVSEPESESDAKTEEE